MIKVIADGVSGILHSIDYKKKTATVEMDYEYLVEYPWDEVVICKEKLWQNDISMSY